MKLIREKMIRGRFVQNGVKQIVDQMFKSLQGATDAHIASPLPLNGGGRAQSVLGGKGAATQGGSNAPAIGGAAVPGKMSYRNICRVTGRSRGVIREYGISRLVFRQ